jgi:hypothetical protein
MANSDWTTSTVPVNNFQSMQVLVEPVDVAPGGTVNLKIVINRSNGTPTLPHTIKLRTDFRRTDGAGGTRNGDGPNEYSIDSDNYEVHHAQTIPTDFPEPSSWDILVSIRDGADPWVIRNDVQIEIPDP